MSMTGTLAPPPAEQATAERFQFDHSNQTEIFDPRQHVWPVTIIGLGGIGSQLAHQLARLGVNSLVLYDDDAVERHNLAYQVYRPRDIGRPKAEATAEILQDFGYDRVTAHAGRVDADTELSGVVISGVDSMASRLAIWETLQFNVAVPLYMDGRIGGEHVQLYTLNPSDPAAIDRYEATLFTDEQAAPLPCAARAVIHPALDIAMRMVAQITNFTRGRPVPFSVTTFTPDFEAYAFI